MKNSLNAKSKVVASNIRKIREFRNYTQEYLAAKLEITQNAYCKIELGYSNLSLERFFKICEILEIDCRDLLQEEETSLIILNNMK